MRKAVYYAAFAAILIPPLFTIPVTAGLTPSEISVSTAMPEFKPGLPQNLNALGAFEGVMAPAGLKKYGWQAEVVFFSNTFSGLPALSFSGRRGGHGFMLLGEYSKLPRIREEGNFLRSAGVPVRIASKETYISDPNGTSTSTYTYDEVSAFRTNTALLALFYYRGVYESGFAQAGLLAGVPFAWHRYKVAAVLDDGQPFDESGSALGVGAAAGVAATFGSTAVRHKGLVCSVFLIYSKLWFGGGGGEVARHLQSRLSGLRFGFSAGWRFSSY